MLCTISESHAHALGPPQGPTYLPLGPTPSILVNTKNSGDTHNASVFILPHTLHHHLLRLGLARDMGYVIFSTMPHWIWDVLSSLVEALTWRRYIRSSAVLQMALYTRSKLPWFIFSFRCFLDNSMLSLGPMSDFLPTLSAHCLSDSAYFISCSWTLVYNFCKLDS